MRLLHRNEDGAVIAIVVISLIALLGMVVITVDVGGLVVQRRSMVNSNDAAALAAAQSFAKKEAGALCGSNEAPARTTADSVAVMNAAGTSRASFTTDCPQQTVTVVYQKEQALFFAPVLGFGDSSTVNATATAKWGQSQGGNPMPIELDPLLTSNCVFETDGTTFKPPGPCPSGYWFNNKDLTNSGWGMMNLQSWGSDPNDNCDNKGGANLLGDWITQAQVVDVRLTQIPTYVCTTDGGKSPNWFRDLESQIGKVFMFPVNDPAQMILGPPNSQEKYAIVAFAPMKVEAIYHGNDTAAIGTPGTAAQSGNCGNNGADLNLSIAGQVNLGVRANASCGAPSTIDRIPYSSVSVTRKQGNDETTYVKCPPSGGSSCDYRYDEVTFDLVWVNALTQSDTNKKVFLQWFVDATPGTPGACGIQSSDPNAKCLVLSWAGPQLIGTDPGPGSGFGAESITLVK